MNKRILQLEGMPNIFLVTFSRLRVAKKETNAIF